jgi:exopolyphosphatase/guanosine-5'-triphosphate,3'-diphosphate pyrophosphatase
MGRVAVIDVGTVTARLALADVDGGKVIRMMRQSNIVNLGQDVDKTGVLAQEACERLLACIDGYLAQIEQARPAAVCCTLTSAARDAKNSADLLAALAARGLTAQVIPGKVEGSLTFLGVAQDFANTKLLVADNGGGSTEFALGSLHNGVLELDAVRSIDVGCRRITEKFLSREDPPADEDIRAAHDFAAQAFAPVADWPLPADAQDRLLVVTGGTSTTLVALEKELVPYDSSKVHLASLTTDAVERQERRLASITVAERAELPGIQAKRAPVILGGVIAVREVMRAAGVDKLTVSESDLLMGLTLTTAATVNREPSPVGWRPEL